MCAILWLLIPSDQGLNKKNVFESNYQQVWLMVYLVAFSLVKAAAIIVAPI
jgi:hypothetical protein